MTSAIEVEQYVMDASNAEGSDKEGNYKIDEVNNDIAELTRCQILVLAKKIVNQAVMKKEM